LAGCGGDSGTDSGSDPGAAGEVGIESDETAPDGDPATEDIDRVDSGEGGGGGGSVDLPGLPIGGSAVEFDEAGTQCARVNWTGDSLPGTVEVRITGFEVPDQFAVSGEACDEVPPCLSGGWLDASGSACSVAITWTGERPADEEPWYLAATSGTVTCEVADECQQTAALAVDAGLQRIEMVADVAVPENESE